MPPRFLYRVLFVQYLESSHDGMTYEENDAQCEERSDCALGDLVRMRAHKARARNPRRPCIFVRGFTRRVPPRRT